MGPVIDNTDAKEQRAGYEAMRQHLEDRALDALLIGSENAHRDIAHMGNRRIGDQLLHVLLHQRHERGVDDGDDGERDRSNGAKSAEATGNIGSEKRRKP